MPAPISFISDFGTSDAYVATVKAVILGIAPASPVVDITHEVAPQAIAQAVFLAEQAWPFFPAGTVHLAVVDPGVGTARRAIALRTPRGYAVGPDNGVLSAALPDDLRGEGQGSALQPCRFDCSKLPSGYEVRELVGQRSDRMSATFHGRDLFGPAAAYLAAGADFEACGALCPSFEVLPRFAGRTVGDQVSGPVIHVDRFGNLLSVIKAEQLPAGAMAATIAGREVPLVRTYGDGTGLVALIGSSGRLEIALVNGSAAAALGAGAGALVTVRG